MSLFCIVAEAVSDPKIPNNYKRGEASEAEISSFFRFGSDMLQCIYNVVAKAGKVHTKDAQSCPIERLSHMATVSRIVVG